MPKQPSAAQSAASKKNDAKGRGPLSPDTKQRSSQNARKWGLFAKTVALPHELPLWAERSNVWHTYYQPNSPASMHLVNECARATLKADRCASFEQSTIAEQTQTETQKWQLAQKRKADRLAKEVRGQPRSTVQKLQSFATGARLMLTEVDGPRLMAVLERASILTEKAARRVTRSHAEARTSYHRASSALWPMLEREKEEGALESVGDDDADEADDAPVAGAAATVGVTLGVTSHHAERDVYDKDADVPVSAVPVSACREEPGHYQIEPEDPAGALAQRVDKAKGSVEGRPSGPERQNGVFRPAPAVENTPSEAPVEGRGSKEEGDVPSVEARPRPEWARMVPLSACRRADSFLTEEEEKAKNGSGQVVDSGEGSVDGQPPGSGRDNGVSSPAQALPEPPFWGLPGSTRAAHFALEPGSEIAARSPGS